MPKKGPMETLWHNINVIVVQMMTGKDNQTTDILRVFGAIGFISIIVYTGIFINIAGVFEVAVYPLQLGAYLTAWAAALRIKEPTEPSPKDEPTTPEIE